MGIRKKTLLILVGLLVVALGTFTVVAQVFVLRGFVQVETTATQKDVNRVTDAIKSELHTINAKGTDWTYWDDTYAFVDDHNKDYIESNLSSTIAGQGIGYWLFYNKKNKLVHTAAYDFETLEPVEPPADLKAMLNPTSPLLGHGDTDGKEVILNLKSGPIMLASRPIMHSDQSGPSNGTVILATPLDAAAIKRLSGTTHLDFTLSSATATDLPADAVTYRDVLAKAANAKHEPVVNPLSDNKIAGYTTLVDGYGNPGLIVRITESRGIYQQGQRTLQYMYVGILILGLTVALAMGWLLNQFVTGPVSRLAQDLGKIRGQSSGKHYAPQGSRVYASNHNDEVGRLAGSINTMLASLEDAHQALEKEKAEVDQKVVERTNELEATQAELAASVRSLPFGFALINHQNEIKFENAMLGHITNPDAPLPEANATTSTPMSTLTTKFNSVIDIVDGIRESQTKQASVERSVAFESSYFRFIFTPVLHRLKNKEAALGTVMIVEDVTEERAIQRSRDEFFSVASHELRTPLTAIRGNSEMIIDYYLKDVKDPDHKQMMEDIHGASVRLIHIVNDFLDSSRLELGKMIFKPGPFNIAELIQGTLREFDVTGSRRKLKLEAVFPKDLPLAFGDPDRTRQIIINLVGNSIRYTKNGGVTIKLTADKNTMKIAITDTGQGIPEKSQYLLFRKFQQASNDILTRDSSSSTGLGLYISKLMAEGMQGTLYLESSVENKGSTFVLELPVDTGQSEPKA